VSSSNAVDVPSPEEAINLIMGVLDARLIRRGDDLTGTPYLWRAYITDKSKSKDGGAFFHRFVSSDDFEYHCHPWAWAYSYIFLGAYIEDRMLAHSIDFDSKTATLDGSTRSVQEFGGKNARINFITAPTFHRVQLVTPEVVSVFVHGPRVQDWGFVAMNEWARPIPMRLMTGHTRDRLRPEQVR